MTKQATTERNFTKAETTFGTDATKRVTLDVNQVISPTLAVRFDALYQDARVAGRNYVTDDRWGGLAAVKWTPTDAIKVTANYVHTDLNGLPDFGVPYNRALRAPSTDINVPRETYYGFLYRDFQKAKQDFGTITTEVQVAPFLTLTNKSRAERSVLDYIGTLPSNPTATTVNLASQSRYQVTDVLANVSDATFRFDTGPVKHTMVAGAEFSQEKVMRDTYAGLTAELSGFQQGNSIVVPLLAPPNFQPFATSPRRANNATNIKVDTKAVYLIETANSPDVVILHGGARFDDYNIGGTTATRGTTAGLHSGMFNYNVGGVLKPLPYASLYAAYATSSNPAGAELDAGSAAYGGSVFNSLPFQALSPEQNKASEVGTKWELFDRHLLVTGALFETVKNNARETQGANIIAGASYRVRGIDLEVAGKITDRWSIFGGLVLMESRVLQSIEAAQIGAQLANIAHQSFNVLTKYKVTEPWEIGGQATYASKIYGGTLLVASTATCCLLALAVRRLHRVQAQQQHQGQAFGQQHLRHRLLRRVLSQQLAFFVFIAPGRSVWMTLSGKL